MASQQGTYLARLFNTMEHNKTLESELKHLESIAETAKTDEDRAALKKELQKKEKALSKIKTVSPFEYTHQGSLAYIGMDRAIADISVWGGNIATGGSLTFLFWRSAYLSMAFSSKFAVSGASSRLILTIPSP